MDAGPFRLLTPSLESGAVTRALQQERAASPRLDLRREMDPRAGAHAPAVSIGNDKGVMLCNRPFAGAAAAAKAGAGLEVGGSGKAFLSGAVPKPHGSNVPIASREINPAVANREKKVTVLHRHRQWLSELQGTKDDLEGKYLDHIAAKEDSLRASWSARRGGARACAAATRRARRLWRRPVRHARGRAVGARGRARGGDDEAAGGGAAAASAAPLAGDEDAPGEVASRGHRAAARGAASRRRGPSGR